MHEFRCETQLTRHSRPKRLGLTGMGLKGLGLMGLDMVIQTINPA